MLNIATDYAQLAPLVKADLSSHPTDELEAVLASIRGGFLADLSLERCFDYEAWRQAIASEVEIVELGILRELVERLANEPRRALPFARRLRRLLPDDAGLAAETEALEEKVRSAAAQATGRAPQSAPPRRRRRRNPLRYRRIPAAPCNSAGLSTAPGSPMPAPAAAR
ncbi:hypothetical protein EOA23_22170 [Mesorhizobium sp. M2A.F.Ca.ET.042.01.1.1]|uniref:hypothetical protein n=1 Tax=Mesorhizobium sp. M2A.F.Ca.ET.042.01.1.1 TaxID=2496745 RepID=UPI000FCC1D3A|nr:hypothetical protein [Mesorhizobium sp. M2A.F.Ca.ET.042.01.1.1]RUX24410.1 hypothetical protein EOA23_22170 [Mesorhizobium sp. M2A.F.Ca.ET.042.01.1.1]